MWEDVQTGMPAHVLLQAHAHVMVGRVWQVWWQVVDNVGRG